MKSLYALIRQSALALMALLLVVFSFLIYFGADSLQRRYVDGRLLALAETLAEIIEHRPGLLMKRAEELVQPDEGNRSQEERHELREVSHSVLVFSSQGQLLWKGSDIAPRPPLSLAILEQVQRGKAVFETVQPGDGTAVRRVTVAIVREGELRYVLQAEASLLFSQKTLQGLIVLLCIGSGTVILMAWLGSRWLAHKVLTPIDVLSSRADGMSETDLGSRLTLDSPFREFQRLTQAFNAMMDRFQRACESQRRFVDYAAHEMQTPLTILQGNLEVTLHKARRPEEYREALINNLEQVERLITLARSLLTLTKFAGDRPPVQLVPLSLEPLLHTLMGELTVLAEDRQITLAFDAQSVPDVHGDPQWIQQAVINLLDNALRYTGSGGTVIVRLQRTKDQVAIAVEDTGPGIEPEHLPHLFERFYRTDGARARDSGGTGLGLPIVKEIAEAHGGFITVDTQVGKGSTFILWLPIPSRQLVSA